MSAESDVAIVNLAFDLVGEAPAASLNDNRPIVRRAKAQYGLRRDLLLRAQPWRFAMGRAELPALSEAPAFGWKYTFTWPANAIRIMPLTVDGEWDSPEIPHRMEGRTILTDKSAPLLVRFVRNDVTENKYDPLFTSLLALSLAHALAYKMTHKRSLKTELREEIREAMSSSALLDSIDGVPDHAIGDDFLDAGYGLASYQGEATP